MVAIVLFKKRLFPAGSIVLGYPYNLVHSQWVIVSDKILGYSTSWSSNLTIRINHILNVEMLELTEWLKC
jgi:hypothetical protein